MLKTRKEVENYALRICVPMLEAAAERRLSRRPAEVVDTIGYVPTLREELFRPFWGITPILHNGRSIHLSIRGEKIFIPKSDAVVSALETIYETLTAQIESLREAVEQVP